MKLDHDDIQAHGTPMTPLEMRAQRRTNDRACNGLDDGGTLIEAGAEPLWEEAEPQQSAADDDDVIQLHWHGEPDDTPLREWLVEDTLFRRGTALISGQWGTYKTFVFAACSSNAITVPSGWICAPPVGIRTIFQMAASFSIMDRPG